MSLESLCQSLFVKRSDIASNQIDPDIGTSKFIVLGEGKCHSVVGLKECILFAAEEVAPILVLCAPDHVAAINRSVRSARVQAGRVDDIDSIPIGDFRAGKGDRIRIWGRRGVHTVIDVRPGLLCLQLAPDFYEWFSGDKVDLSYAIPWAPEKLERFKLVIDHRTQTDLQYIEETLTERKRWIEDAPSSGVAQACDNCFVCTLLLALWIFGLMLYVVHHVCDSLAVSSCTRALWENCRFSDIFS
jgi:hypothetical protein